MFKCPFCGQDWRDIRIEYVSTDATNYRCNACSKFFQLMKARGKMTEQMAGVAV